MSFSREAIAAATVAAMEALRGEGHEVKAIVVIAETEAGEQQMAAYPLELRETWELIDAAALAVETSFAADAERN